MINVLVAQGIGFKLGVPELSGGVLVLAAFALAAWALIDAAKYPDKDWTAVGQTKGNWVLMIILCNLFCGPIGPVISIYYLVVIRANLKARQSSSF